jgi:hypothetical protein
MQHWQRVWRCGIAPQLTPAALAALRQALLRDDPRLMQGRTMAPPPLPGLEDAEVEAACAIGWAGWHGEGHGRIAALERYFDRVCSEVDDVLGEPGAARAFLDWYDTAPRAVMRQMLLNEVNQVLNALNQQPLAA